MTSEEQGRGARPYRLIYVSHIAPARAAGVEAVMRDILLASHRRNRQDGITGLLLTNGAWFTQVLEGDEVAVEACYDRIAVDPRHVLPSVRSRGAVQARRLDRWSMCGLTLSHLDDLLLQAPETPFDIWSLPGDALLQLLCSVATRFGDALDLLHAELGAEVGPPA